MFLKNEKQNKKYRNKGEYRLLNLKTCILKLLQKLITFIFFNYKYTAEVRKLERFTAEVQKNMIITGKTLKTHTNGNKH